MNSGVLRHLLGLGDGFVDAADHVERRFGEVIILALDHRLERADRVLELDELAADAGEDLGDVERLAQELLDLPRTLDGELILFRQFVHAENRDDVLQRFVLLQRRLDRTRGVVMHLADDAWLEQTRGRVERIDCRVDAQLRDRTVEVGRRIEMRE